MELLHLALLPAHMIGDVFTQFGTANVSDHSYRDLAQKVVAIGVIA